MAWQCTANSRPQYRSNFVQLATIRSHSSSSDEEQRLESMIDVGKLAAGIGVWSLQCIARLHAWSGCDTVSALASQGQNKGFEAVQANDLLIFKLPQIWDLRGMYQQTSFNSIQAFTWSAVNRAEHEDRVLIPPLSHVFCAKKGQIESGHLQPCEELLDAAYLRANYTGGFIWRKRSLETCQTSQHHQQTCW
ncbi:hypothetical protein GWK47_042292 [Chionoecetes opilio]|uniref:Uncharacterized protein n=1 Tax=Chionoecetes opilio TaxID=41210 RepID=A0A8J4YHC9_CHIOP|nr:hypothetical protein GWK47_042292 [Chionoecetes opilio]